MRQVILPVLLLSLLFLLDGCRKDDKVYRKRIQGDWGAQLWDKQDSDVGYKKLSFADNGYYKFYVFQSDTADRCAQIDSSHLERDSLRYYIEDGHLFKQDPYVVDEKIREYRIIKLNDDKMNIVIADRGKNQSVSDRLREQEKYEKCK